MISWLVDSISQWLNDSMIHRLYDFMIQWPHDSVTQCLLTPWLIDSKDSPTGSLRVFPSPVICVVFCLFHTMDFQFPGILLLHNTSRIHQQNLVGPDQWAVGGAKRGAAHLFLEQKISVGIVTSLDPDAMSKAPPPTPLNHLSVTSFSISNPHQSVTQDRAAADKWLRVAKSLNCNSEERLVQTV